MKKSKTKEQKAKRAKINVIYIYVIVTIALVFFALLISTQSFFNPLNFQPDAICYLERSQYNNPMLISFSIGAQKDKTYVFQDKRNLYAMFVYLQNGELVEMEQAFGVNTDLEAIFNAESTCVYEVFSQSVDMDHVFLCYDPGVDCEYLIVECMPDYPQGELKLMAVKKTPELNQATSSLKSTGLKGLEAN